MCAEIVCRSQLTPSRRQYRAFLTANIYGVRQRKSQDSHVVIAHGGMPVPLPGFYVGSYPTLTTNQSVPSIHYHETMSKSSTNAWTTVWINPRNMFGVLLGNSAQTNSIPLRVQVFSISDILTSLPSVLNVSSGCNESKTGRLHVFSIVTLTRSARENVNVCLLKPVRSERSVVKLHDQGSNVLPIFALSYSRSVSTGSDTTGAKVNLT